MKGCREMKVHTVQFHLYKVLGNANWYIGIKADQSLLEDEGQGGDKKGIAKWQKKTSWGDGYIHYLDCGDIPWVYKYIKMLNQYNLNMNILVYITDVSISC